MIECNVAKCRFNIWKLELWWIEFYPEGRIHLGGNWFWRELNFFIPVKVVIFTYTKFKHIIMASKLEKKEKINFINEVEFKFVH